jgi:hypothetical protein
VVIWLHDGRWLAHLLGGVLACWLVAVAAILLGSRLFGIPEPATVASSWPWAPAGGTIVVLLLGLACSVHPDPWGSSLLPGTADGFGDLALSDRRLSSSLAIALAAALTGVGWLIDGTAAWAVLLAMAVLLPWVVLRTVHAPLASVFVLGLLVERSYSLIAGSGTAGTDSGWWLTAIALLWTGYLIGWLHNRGWLPWLLGLTAIGTAVALAAAMTGIAPNGSWKADAALLPALDVLTRVAWRLRVSDVHDDRPGRSPWGEATWKSRGHAPLRLFGDDLPTGAAGLAADAGALQAGLAAEDEMFENLLRALPAGTRVLKSLTLPQMYGDLDILVIGNTGVFVIEVKYWAGEIWCSGDGHAWARRKRGVLETMRDPAGQASGCVRSLHSYLEQEDESLCARVRLWIEAFIVFTHPAGVVDARRQSGTRRVARARCPRDPKRAASARVDRAGTGGPGGSDRRRPGGQMEPNDLFRPYRRTTRSPLKTSLPRSLRGSVTRTRGSSPPCIDDESRLAMHWCTDARGEAHMPRIEAPAKAPLCAARRVGLFRAALPAVPPNTQACKGLISEVMGMPSRSVFRDGRRGCR